MNGIEELRNELRIIVKNMYKNDKQLHLWDDKCNMEEAIRHVGKAISNLEKIK